MRFSAVCVCSLLLGAASPHLIVCFYRLSFFSGFPYVFFRIVHILQKQLMFLVPNGLYFQQLISFLGLVEENPLYVYVSFLAAHKLTACENIILAGNSHCTRFLCE
jgi:hypothetical protein